ncbi:unnamed protein product [Ectocarpus sp. 4 AP-2014]
MALASCFRRVHPTKSSCKAVVVLALCCRVIAFAPFAFHPTRRNTPSIAPPSAYKWKHAQEQQPRMLADMDSRAGFLRTAAAAAIGGAALVVSGGSQPSSAAEVATTEFVDFEDSRGLFSCRIPKNFLRAERAKDKRGTVFVAGDYSKAEVLSVQVVKAFDLLTDAGLPTVGDLTKWENVGKPAAIADLLKQRRDSDAAGGTPVESVVLPGVTLDGDVLQFMLKSPIKVMRADLLEKEQGVSELYRNTYVKAIMRGDGSFLVVWAGALNTDWDQEGGAKDRLKVATDSFRLEGLIVEGVRLGAV